MKKSNKAWFKLKEDTGRLTASSPEGWLLLISYACLLGLVMALASWLIDKGEISAWLGIPLIVIYAIVSTTWLFRIAFTHVPVAKTAGSHLLHKIKSKAFSVKKK